MDYPTPPHWNFHHQFNDWQLIAPDYWPAPHNPIIDVNVPQTLPPPPELNPPPPEEESSSSPRSYNIFRILLFRCRHSSSASRRVHPDDLHPATGCQRCRRCRRRAARRRNSFAASVALAAAFASGGFGPFLIAVEASAASASFSSLPSESLLIAGRGRSQARWEQMGRRRSVQRPTVLEVATAAGSEALVSNDIVTLSQQPFGQSRAVRAVPSSLSLSSRSQLKVPISLQQLHGRGSLSCRTRLFGGRREAHSALAASTSPVSEGDEEERQLRPYHIPLSRPHERAIFLFHLFSGIALNLLLAYRSSLTLTRSHVESILASTWSAFVMAISFTEAWVKFRAPFLRKYIAVDVGRHVFAALNSAELAFSAVLWAGRWVAGMVAASAGSGGAAAAAATCSARGGFCLLVYIAGKLARPVFVLPAIATVALLWQVLWIEPALSFRGKATIVDGFESNPESLRLLDDREEKELQTAKSEVEGLNIPSAKWHLVYVILEMIKVGCLSSLAIVSLI